MDLASWALRGITGGGYNGNNDANNNDNTVEGRETSSAAVSENPLTPEEMRAQRLARMEARLAQQAQQQQVPEAMDVDPPEKIEKKKKPVPPAAEKKAAVASAPSTTTPVSPTLKKKAKCDPHDRSTKKVQREKELLLKKTLSVALVGGALTSDSSCVVIDIGSTEITDQSIAEILAERVAMHHTLPNAAQNPLIRFLGTSHRLAAQELKDLQSSASSSPSKAAPSSNDLISILVELQRQLVSYAASCIMEPDLFPAGQDSVQQLAMCLLTTISDLNTSIILGVNKSTSSFFYLLVEELKSQQADLKHVVQEVVVNFTSRLSKIDSVLDAVDAGHDGMLIVSALAALAMHKDTAKEMSLLSNFLLPKAGSSAAKELVRPQISPGNLFQMFSGENRPYKRRSGPGLEKQTILGLALRIGIPLKANPAFTTTGIFSMSVNAIDGVNTQQRNKLVAHQEACNQLIKALIKAGEEPRARFMDWVRDALLVNYGADAMRPDPSKVSSTNLLLNLSVVLLKLCEPLVADADNKIQTIKPSFVSSANHGGVFETEGDHAVPRLGSKSDDDAVMLEAYDPKNKFISPCFFFCARSLHYGLCPALSHHENLLRHIMYQHHDIRDSGRDLRSDPQFGMMLCRQRSAEVALFEPTHVTESLRFCDFLAHFLLSMDDETLCTMPEDFINDCCSIIMSVAKLKSELLRGMNMRYIFQMAVKLLSPRYGSVSDNS
jgi:hypothetical protein